MCDFNVSPQAQFWVLSTHLVDQFQDCIVAIQKEQSLITFILIPMDHSNIEVKPITHINYTPQGRLKNDKTYLCGYLLISRYEGGGLASSNIFTAWWWLESAGD